MIETFNRVEYKYIITQEQYLSMKDKLEEKMNLDSNCLEGNKYKITNYYLDTANFDLIRKSVTKPKYKQKLRIRVYDSTDSLEQLAYFEIKKKYCGTVNKRRIELPLKEAFKLTNKEEIDETKINKQIYKEIKYILEQNEYEVKTKIEYERIAYFSKNNPELRISFDYNIRSNNNGLFLEENEILMEIKTSNSIDLWLVEILNRFKIKRNAFSKYGIEYFKMLKEI